MNILFHKLKKDKYNPNLKSHEQKHNCNKLNINLPDQQRGRCCKVSTLKLDMQLPTWRNQTPSGEKFYNQMKQRLCCFGKMT